MTNTHMIPYMGQTVVFYIYHYIPFFFSNMYMLIYTSLTVVFCQLKNKYILLAQQSRGVNLV